MVSEHNDEQPMEANGVMDRVEVVSTLQKSFPLAGISSGGSTILVLSVYINAFM